MLVGAVRCRTLLRQLERTPDVRQHATSDNRRPREQAECHDGPHDAATRLAHDEGAGGRAGRPPGDHPAMGPRRDAHTISAHTRSPGPMGPRRRAPPAPRTRGPGSWRMAGRRAPAMRQRPAQPPVPSRPSADAPGLRSLPAAPARDRRKERPASGGIPPVAAPRGISAPAAPPGPPPRRRPTGCHTAAGSCNPNHMGCTHRPRRGLAQHVDVTAAPPPPETRRSEIR